ncbi:MAG: asparagine synthase (glutamine-hydrolyzing) [Candidatus Pacebacteria bacterium]|nr:asparagine synthase (glutamine-hydrolyzing) [Candidatus Paceibacterota bacterium]
MCGICGTWRIADRIPVPRMVEAMRHRGPDDNGELADGPAHIGMTRLAIIDASSGGHQPMSNAASTVWIVYNGEMYSFAEEREALRARGETFVSGSDTEVVLRMYEVHGDDFLKRLRGMFALAIYDKRGGVGRERLLLARDQLGIKPLLYASVGSGWVFASEMKALLAGGLIPRRMDPIGLRQLLTFGSVYQPRTMVDGVKMLLPGHKLVLDHRGARDEVYWTPTVGRRADVAGADYEEQVEVLQAALADSVARHMVSDVPLGAFLSGGVDSSTLVALMARQAGRRVKTFSVGFEAEGRHIDESGEARAIAEQVGAEHTHVTVTGADVADQIHDIARGLDQPSVDGVNSYFVSKAAKLGMTVAISGTGGDELFAGYPWFRQMAFYEQQMQEAGPWSRTVEEGVAALATCSSLDSVMRGARRWRLAKWRERGFLFRYAACYGIFGELGALRLLAPDVRAAAQAGHSQARDIRHNDMLSGAGVVERVSALCIRGYTTNQLLRDIDAVSMAHSLEVRVPFLDVPMLDLALSLPPETKLGPVSGPEREGITYNDSGTKRILLDVNRRLLGRDLGAQPKRGFAMPFDEWLRGPLRPVLLETTSRPDFAGGLLDPLEVAAVRQSFLDGKSTWARPWLLMMLELWRQEVLN